MTINAKIADYFEKRIAQGASSFVLCGGRRSGKTYFACQFLLGKASQGDVVNVASMTMEQGRLGAYADCETIIRTNYQSWWEIQKSPRQINAKYPADNGNQGKLFFNSYADSETAKGVACDWLYINEANNFSKQQYIDLMANVRKGVIIDYNPNIKFWVDDFFSEQDICNTTWKDNEGNLSKPQLEYFYKLKELGDRPDASPIDRRNYLVYYCGQYAEIIGKVFSPMDIVKTDKLPTDLTNFVTFCDPSALRGADWFPIVTSAYSPTECRTYIVEVDSVNDGCRELQAKKLRDLSSKYDDLQIYIETNGIIGIDFYEYCINSELPINAWYSRGKKFDRIVAQYEGIKNLQWHETDALDKFLEQVYDFDTKCEHDDNIDAVASSVMLQRFLKS